MACHSRMMSWCALEQGQLNFTGVTYRAGDRLQICPQQDLANHRHLSFFPFTVMVRCPPLGYMLRQYFDYTILTCCTVSTAWWVAAVGDSRSGGSPMSVRVTARADLEMERKL